MSSKNRTNNNCVMQLLMCVCVLVSVLTRVQGLPHSKRSQPLLVTCSEDVKSVIAKQRLNASLVEYVEHTGDQEPSICGLDFFYKGSCCSKSLEQQIKQKIPSDIRLHIQKGFGTTSNVLRTTIDDLQMEYRMVLNKELSFLIRLLRESHLEDYVPHLEKMFDTFKNYVLDVKSRTMQSQVTLAINRFFENIFPAVFYWITNPEVSDFTPDYKRCLVGAAEKVKPFGDHLNEADRYLGRALNSNRLVLQTLDALSSAVNNTQQLQINNNECAMSYAQMVYCPVCRNQLNVVPCKKFCLNVMRGCLPHINDLNEPWKDALESLIRMSDHLKVKPLNMKLMLREFQKTLSSAITYAVGEGFQVVQQVKRICGDPRRTSEKPPGMNYTAVINSTHSGQLTPAEDLVDNKDLVDRMITMKTRMEHLLQEDVFSELSNNVCGDAKSNCWNGQEVGEYTKTVVPAGYAHQHKNPEMVRATDPSQETTATNLKLKLQHVTETMQNQLWTVTKKSRQMPNTGKQEISGSGDGADPDTDRSDRSWNPDDEDAEFGSGSGDGIEGSGALPKGADVSETPATTPSVPQKDSSSRTGSGVATAISIATLVLLYSRSSRVHL